MTCMQGIRIITGSSISDTMKLTCYHPADLYMRYYAGDVITLGFMKGACPLNIVTFDPGHAYFSKIISITRISIDIDNDIDNRHICMMCNSYVIYS